METGAIEPQDPLGRELQAHVESRCSPETLVTFSTPGPTPSPTPAATPESTPTPIAQTMEEARELVWVYLSQCIFFEPVQLGGHLVRGDWFVQASSNAAREYGVWKVDPATGSLEPHDGLARDLQSLVEARCSDEAYATLFPPTPTPVPAPTTFPHPHSHTCPHAHTNPGDREFWGCRRRGVESSGLMLPYLAIQRLRSQVGSGHRRMDRPDARDC